MDDRNPFARVWLSALLTGLACLAGMAFSACAQGGKTPPPKTPVTLQLQWNHTAANAGYYAAILKGFYAVEGLEVSLLEGGFDHDTITTVLSGTAQFAEAPPETLIQARAQGKALTAFAAIYRRSPVVFVAKSSTGITHPRQFRGKTIRISRGFSPTLHALMTKTGIPPGDYREVLLPSDPKLFATGEVPIWGAYLNVLVVGLKNAGENLNIIYPDDYRVHFYARALFTTDELIIRDPDLVRRFLRATIAGWAYMVEHPDEAAAMVGAFNPGADTKMENQVMLLTIPLVSTGEDIIGWMKPPVWEEMAAIFRMEYRVPETFDVRRVYTTRFLEELREK